MQLTTSSASSILKHIGGLNLITFSQGPSVLTKILSSFNLIIRNSHLCIREVKKLTNIKQLWCGLKSIPLHQQSCCFCGGSLLFSVCYQLNSHKQSCTSLKKKSLGIKITQVFKTLVHTAVMPQQSTVGVFQ